MKYFFDLRGEDNTEFVWETDAPNKNAAVRICEALYPEAQMMKVQSQEEYNEVENERYLRLVHEMDNDCDMSGDNWW
jgi:hypothetical protein